MRSSRCAALGPFVPIALKLPQPPDSGGTISRGYAIFVKQPAKHGIPPSGDHYVQYFYDDRFRLQKRRLEQSPSTDVAFTYDYDGQIATVTAGSPSVLMAISRGTNGQLTSVNTAGNGGGVTETWEYFPSWGDIKQICGFATSGGSCSTNIYKFTYTRELGGTYSNCLGANAGVTGRVRTRGDVFSGGGCDSIPEPRRTISVAARAGRFCAGCTSMIEA